LTLRDNVPWTAAACYQVQVYGWEPSLCAPPKADRTINGTQSSASLISRRSTKAPNWRQWLLVSSIGRIKIGQMDSN